MSDPIVTNDRPKKDRSPSFPFVSLRRAMPAAAPTWGYGTKSSGFLQTVAALKQYGLIEDVGSGEDRKIRLTDLARSIISDTRPGVKQAALQTAAQTPKLFAEYIERWVPDSPSDSHCISELEHDRGFTPDAAKSFLKSFKLTVSYAGLMARDSLSASSEQSAEQEEETEVDTQPSVSEARAAGASSSTTPMPAAPVHESFVPFRRRYQVTMADNKLTITATLIAPSEVDKLIRLLEANKALLDGFDVEENTAN